MMANTKNELESIIIEPKKTATKSVIWMHGLGADGNDFVSIVPELHLPESFGMRFVFPHAPVMPVTLNSGMEMRAWFDIATLTLEGISNWPGIKTSYALVSALIKKEVEKGIKTENIIVAGFSQGAVMALVTGICYPEKLRGVIALSGFLPDPRKLFTEASEVNCQIPIFLAHGTADMVAPFVLGKAAETALKQANYPVTWHSYPMPHSVCMEEIHDISQWIQGLWA